MIQKRTVISLFLPMILMLAFTIVGPAVAMEGGSKNQAHAKHGKMEGKKSQSEKGGMHGSMGLTMTNMRPSKTMKFLDHFKKWVEITPEQASAWGAFSKAIKIQAASKPGMRHMVMAAGPVARAELMIARAEKMVQMRKNTLEAYKALLQVLDDQQVQLADGFLSKHMMKHKGMKKRGKKGRH